MSDEQPQVTRNFTDEQVAAAARSGGYVILTITEPDGTVHEHLAVAAPDEPQKEE